MNSLDKCAAELCALAGVSLLALVKAYIIDIWEVLSVLNNPALILQPGILWGLMGRIVKGCVREVSLAQVNCILMYVHIALPTPMVS